jgi:hypothetical protein
MHTDILSEEDFTCLLVGVGVADAQKQSEVSSQVFEELSLSVEAEGTACFDEDLEFVAAVAV